MTTLAHLAARTRRVLLGTLVLCNSFRHPGQLAREAAALADASGGRFLMGLGAGWHRPEYDAFDIPFDHRLGRLEETLRVLRPLLSGERVDFEGRHLRLRGATVLTTAPPPPIWVGAGGPRGLELTARMADGWNSGWHGADTADFESRLADLRRQLELAGRPPGQVEVSAGIFVLPVAGEEAGRLLEETPWLRSLLGGGPLERQALVGGPERIAQGLRAYAEAGADHAIVNLSLTPFGGLDPRYPEAVAAALRLLR